MAMILMMEAVIAVVVFTMEMTTVKDKFINVVNSVMTAEAVMVEVMMVVTMKQ